MARITQAIDAGELRHSGEICFAVEPALHWRHVLRGTDARERAEQAFSKLRVWDTEANTGVLLYVLLADHRLEIVADRGLRGIDPAAWRAVCATIEAGLRSDDPGSAIVRGHRGDLRPAGRTRTARRRARGSRRTPQQTALPLTPDVAQLGDARRRIPRLAPLDVPAPGRPDRVLRRPAQDPLVRPDVPARFRRRLVARQPPRARRAPAGRGFDRASAT